jgi:hypothetical protein
MTGLALDQTKEVRSMPGHALAVVRTEPQQLDFGTVMKLSSELITTGFLPDHIKTPAQCTAIILTGHELGMAPMRSLRSLQIVKGKVTENADSQLARFKTDGGRAQFVELTEEKAVLFLKHPNGDEHTESFTMEDARRAGLGDMYKKYPKAMLRSRAITAGLKSIGWEGGAGAYDPSELEPSTPPSGRATTATARVSERPAGVDATGEDHRPMTLEEAALFVLPGKPEAWGGNGGKILGEIRNSMLSRVKDWCLKQLQTENGYGDAQQLLDAANLMLSARADGRAIEPAKKDAAAPAAPAAAKEELHPALTKKPSDDLPF